MRVTKGVYSRFLQTILIDFLIGAEVGEFRAKLTSLQSTTQRCYGYSMPFVVLYTTSEYSKIHDVSNTASI